VRELVEREHGGRWPEDTWFDVGPSWSVNVWREGGRQRITAYRDSTDAQGFRQTDAFAGIRLQ
jgi:hypothetical protein